MLMKIKRNKKGFTLAELLIVIAIIAILVAIAIPAFTAALDSAKKATDDANIRAAYAEYQTDLMQSQIPGSSVSAPADLTAAGARKTYVETNTATLQWYTDVVANATTGKWEGTK